MTFKSLSACGIVFVLCSATFANDVDFGRDILPLLSDNCFKCHGPDEANREAGLRLDRQEGAVGQLESGTTALVPGHSGKSELFKRLTSSDPDLKMPPVDSGKKLTAAQIDLIKQWIDQGAEWSGHWAFEAPQDHPVPVAHKDWKTNNAIDNFIHAELQKANLVPEQRASKETLIRRVTLDLTGLPPTIAEIDNFLADKSPQAFERVVDRVLASKSYGEHMARIWLDAARYGDTHGLHLDNERSIWPYRDWVIASYNKNQPFDEFTIEQLAGDLLPEPELSQRVATGFNRCNVTTGEGGSINEEYYVRYAVDRVETTSTVWLGLTAGCAACHDHKFDPLSQKEFYQLFSYFFSLTENAMDGNKLLPPPSIKVPSPKQTQQEQEYQQTITRLNQQIASVLAEFSYTDPAPDVPLGPLTTSEFVWIDDKLPPGAKAQGDGPNPWKFVTAPDHPVKLGKNSHTRKGGGLNQHFFTDASDKLKLGENAKLFAWVYIDPTDKPKTLQLQFNDGGWNHRATWGADRAFGAGQNNAANRRMGKLPKAGEWVKLEVSAEQVGLKAGSELNGWAFTQFDGTVHWDAAGVTYQALSDEQKRSLFAWEQFRKNVKTPPVPKNIQTLLDLAADKRNEQQKKQLTTYFLKHVHPDSRAQLSDPLAKLDDTQTKLAALKNEIPATLVMEDRKKPRQAHILERGEYTQKREPVSPAVPAWLAPPVKDAPGNRLGLAQWLVQPDHPLTARVAVNRFWQQFFGIGLVRTSEDFGVQGEQPSHPQLLDWLAKDFVQSGWNVKRFMKQIVMSATYQQASVVDRDKLAIDPENRLLARGPRFRLDAEVIRDQALQVSGLMNPVIGGKSVKPYQPAGLWAPVGFGGSNTARFVQDKGDKLFRRSMYTFWKRTSPPPSMSTFDAPNRETCQVRRARTNTPLQALVLMNDVQFVEAARKFAERVLHEGGKDTKERITFAFRTVVSRQPTATELQSLSNLYGEYQSEFKADLSAAEKLLAVGDSPFDPNLEISELAAWTMVTHVVLNLSETVTRG